MKILVEREIFTEQSTISPFSINGKPKGYILEDKCRQEFGKPFTKEMKVYGETAIPYGIYEIEFRPSPKFNGKLMPYLKDVPFYSNIMMHIGNKSVDTLGCLLVGKTKGVNFVYESTNLFKEIYPIMLDAWTKKEKIEIEITKKGVTNGTQEKNEKK